MPNEFKGFKGCLISRNTKTPAFFLWKENSGWPVDGAGFIGGQKAMDGEGEEGRMNGGALVPFWVVKKRQWALGHGPGREDPGFRLEFETSSWTYG